MIYSLFDSRCHDHKFVSIPTRLAVDCYVLGNHKCATRRMSNTRNPSRPATDVNFDRCPMRSWNWETTRKATSVTLPIGSSICVYSPIGWISFILCKKLFKAYDYLCIDMYLMRNIIYMAYSGRLFSFCATWRLNHMARTMSDISRGLHNLPLRKSPRMLRV